MDTADKSHEEDLFIARLLRGFNYKDCLEYEDPNDRKRIVLVNYLDHYREYSPVLCMDCETDMWCKIKQMDSR